MLFLQRVMINELLYLVKEFSIKFLFCFSFWFDVYRLIIYFGIFFIIGLGLSESYSNINIVNIRNEDVFFKVILFLLFSIFLFFVFFKIFEIVFSWVLFFWIEKNSIYRSNSVEFIIRNNIFLQFIDYVELNVGEMIDVNKSYIFVDKIGAAYTSKRRATIESRIRFKVPRRIFIKSKMNNYKVWIVIGFFRVFKASRYYKL